MAITIVATQTGAQVAAISTQNVTLSQATGAGNNLVFMGGIQGQFNVCTPTGGGVGTTWVTLTSNYTQGPGSQIWLASNVPAGVTSFTALSGGGVDVAWIVMEVAGLSTTVDTTGGGSGASTTAMNLNAVTTANATDLLVGSVHIKDSGPAISSGPTNGWTQIGNPKTSITELITAYLVTTQTGSYSTSWVVGSSVTFYDGSTAAIQAAPPPASPTIGLPSSNVVPVLTIQQW